MCVQQHGLAIHQSEICGRLPVFGKALTQHYQIYLALISLQCQQSYHYLNSFLHRHSLENVNSRIINRHW